MADSRLLFAVLLAGLATGCNPTLRGECSSQSDCATGLVCFNQLCVNPRWVPDGGSSCSPACASGQSCVSGTCVSSEGVGIQIVSPIGGAALLGKPLEVAVQAVAPDPISAVEVRLMTRDQVIQQIRAEVKNDTYLATLDLADPNITDGYYQLVARMYRGEQKDDSTPVHVVIDKTGPSLAMLPIEYPTRASGSPSEGSFLRDEQVVIDVSVSDPLTGLSSEPPVLKAFGMDPVIGVPKAGHVVRFTFSARAPVFRKVLGEVNVTVLASDVAGNTSTLAASFRLSRLRWSWTKPGSKGTSTAPAVLGNLLVIGGDDSSLHAVRREDGSAAWDMSLAGKPVGHITAGQSRVYAALSDGHVVAIDPQEGSVPQRVVFTCPAQPTFPGPRAMVSGLALGMTQISGMNTVLEETLFAYTSDGHVQMFRGSVFPTGYYGTNGGCMVETSGSVGSGNDGTVPALVSVNGGTTVFVGDNHGAVHKVGLTFTTRSNIGQNQPSYSLDENAAFDTGQSIKSTVAVGTVHDTPGLFVSNGTGKVRALDTMNNGLWETAPMSQTQGLRATPVTNGTSAYQHDQSGRLQQISTTDGTFSWQQEVSGPSRSSAANASPVVAKDGSVFVTGGPVALGYSATGVTQWSFDARSLPESPGTLLVDAVSPVLSCDGTLYVVATDADHALVHAIITDSTGGIAAAGWPAGQHDSRNTANANAALVGGDGMCAD